MKDARGLEADGGNLYEPHPLQVHSGKFWRCAHDSTGFARDLEWIGCAECRAANPEGAKNFAGLPGEASP